jgi:integrase
LSDPALQIIKQRLCGLVGGFVFPGPGEAGHFIEPKFTWLRIRKLAKIKDCTIHDLRRTMASFQAMNGTSLSIIGKSLGHRTTAATAIYARIDLQAVRQSVDAAAQAMVAAQGGAK